LVVESFPAGVLESLGLGYNELAKVNRRLVLTSITPYGHNGPYTDYPASDINIMAAGGMLGLHADIDRPPVRFSVPLAGFLGSLHAATGSVVALTHAELTGEGQQVDVSCQEAVAMSLMDATEFWDMNHVNRQIVGPYNITRRRDLPDLVVPRVWECKDGHMLIGLLGGLLKGVAVGSNALIEMANAHGMALALKGYDFADYDTSTISVEESDRMISAMGAFFKTMTKKELFEMAVSRGSLAFPVNTVADIADSPQFKERDFWVEVEDPEGKQKITFPGLPMQIEGMQYAVVRRAPRVGEHNREIYRRELGLTAGEMILLKSQGII
jgi:benzylsuccinate CoA-transferase BbsE subunit